MTTTKLRPPREGYACRSCGKWGPNGEVHTFLFCELHKMGWSREQIIANVLFTVDALRGDSRDTGEKPDA